MHRLDQRPLICTRVETLSCGKSRDATKASTDVDLKEQKQSGCFPFHNGTLNNVLLFKTLTLSAPGHYVRADPDL